MRKTLSDSQTNRLSPQDSSGTPSDSTQNQHATEYRTENDFATLSNAGMWEGAPTWPGIKCYNLATLRNTTLPEESE